MEINVGYYKIFMDDTIFILTDISSLRSLSKWTRPSSLTEAPMDQVQAKKKIHCKKTNNINLLKYWSFKKQGIKNQHHQDQTMYNWSETKFPKKFVYWVSLSQILFIWIQIQMIIFVVLKKICFLLSWFTSPLNHPNTLTDLQPRHDFSVFHLGDFGLILEFLHEGVHQVHQALYQGCVRGGWELL